ncbi:MAG TPA: hypothetical protein VKY27_11620 [Bacteriovoracaceae bacterium]|nr:hypothetical protein [Bacteriovoracaceae bacterium]
MKRFLRHRGQTSVEYMLILVVTITIGIAFKKKMEEFMLTNPNSFISKQLNSLQAGLAHDTSGRFTRFPLR